MRLIRASCCSVVLVLVLSSCAFFGGGGGGGGGGDGDSDDFDGAQGEDEVLPGEGEGGGEGENEGGEGEGEEGEGEGGGNCRLRSGPTPQHYEYLCDDEGEVIELYGTDSGHFFRNRYASVDSVSMYFQSLYPPHGDIVQYRIDQNVTSPLDPFTRRQWVTVSLCDYQYACPPRVPSGIVSDSQRLVESNSEYKIYERIDCGSGIYPAVDISSFTLFLNGDTETISEERFTDRSRCPDVDDVKNFSAIVFPGVDLSMARIQASPAYQLLLADQ